MIFAFVSYQGDGSGMMYELARRGNDVYVWIGKNYRFLEGVKGIYFERNIKLETFLGRHTKHFIVFDGQEYSSYQDFCRERGYVCIGSSRFGEKIESDRIFQYKVAQKLNVKVPKTYVISSLDEAIEIIKKGKRKYILKQNGNLPKSFNWKAELEDSSDLIAHIYSLKDRYKNIKDNFVIQEVVEGVEVATSAFWTQTGWLKGINGEILLEVNFEHKSLLDGDRGISTGEMGTVAFFVEGRNRIFNEMILPLQPILERFKNYGNVDANCIVTPEGDLYLLEWTIRFGYPITDLYIELAKDFEQFIRAMYSGGVVDVYEYPTIGIVWVLGFPVFPYEKAKGKIESFLGEPLLFTDESVMKHFHPAFVNWCKECNTWRISDPYGYAGTITYKGEKIENVIRRGVKAIESIIPARKGFYRTDIGERVIKALRLDYVRDVIFAEQSKAEQSSVLDID